MDTARPLAERLGSQPIEASGALNDVDVGRWEGVPIAEAARRDPELWRVWCERPQEFGFPGGDNLSDVAGRCLRLIADLRSRYQGGGDVALFTHQVPAKLIVAGVMGAGPAAFWRLRMDNAGVSVAEHDGRGYTLTLHNATAHLPR
jgi:broad specificity phosphatase PhoE